MITHSVKLQSKAENTESVQTCHQYCHD